MPEDFTEDLGAQYRAAKEAVTEHVRRWAEAGIAKHRWLKKHRGVPAHKLYDPKTGEPVDPELAALEAAERQAHADSEWCRALVVAIGEQIKGQPFEELVKPRPVVDLSDAVPAKPVEVV